MTDLPKAPKVTFLISFGATISNAIVCIYNTYNVSMTNLFYFPLHGVQLLFISLFVRLLFCCCFGDYHHHAKRKQNGEQGWSQAGVGVHHGGWLAESPHPYATGGVALPHALCICHPFCKKSTETNKVEFEDEKLSLLKWENWRRNTHKLRFSILLLKYFT